MYWLIRDWLGFPYKATSYDKNKYRVIKVLNRYIPQKKDGYKWVGIDNGLQLTWDREDHQFKHCFFFSKSEALKRLESFIPRDSIKRISKCDYTRCD